MLDLFFKWLKGIFSTKSTETDKPNFIRKAPIKFSEITVVERTPRNNEVKADTLYLVDKGNKPKWVMFLCPCGCSHVITLSLQKIHNPNWRLSTELSGRPTLHPSVWQKTECYSHFWLHDGRVYWCEGTGNPSSFW